MKIYQPGVSIVGIGRVYRIIEVSDECTFEKLQNIIFNSFGMDEDHLYSFYITKTDTKSIRTIRESLEIKHLKVVKSVGKLQRAPDDFYD